MSRTTKSFRGQTYRDRNARSKRTGSGKKFFGFTSGEHSRGIHKRVRDADGGYEYVRDDRAPVRGVDYVKYGWPLELRHRSVLRDLAITREMDREMDDMN